MAVGGEYLRLFPDLVFFFSLEDGRLLVLFFFFTALLVSLIM